MKLYFSLLFSLFTIAAWAQPANDECSGAVDLGMLPVCSDPAEYTNVAATASNIDPVFNIPDCFSSGVQRDVWFSFTVPNDGSIVDVTVTVTGNQDGNGTLQNPQFAVYRGDCTFGGLNEIDCASAPNGENSISLDLFGLSPGLTYYVRVNDYSATATPNAGTFKICATEYVAEINIGEVPSSQSCTGTLYDSGGPTGDYTNGENHTFTICPQDFHQCIVINVETYNTENNFDFLTFYQGEDLTGVQLGEISGDGLDLEVQISGDCATLAFSSDGSAVDAGFKLTWSCTTSPCTTPPVVTCADPVAISTLPYDAQGLSNCFSGNTIFEDPCGSQFLDGNDYVFTYTSQGDECITVNTTTSNNAGIGVYSNCPTDPDAACIAVAGGNFGVDNPSISSAFLENAGTYYIVFSTPGACATFSLNVDTVSCPVVLPPASTCDAALNIGGCSTTLPEIIALNPGSGDPNFLVNGVNQGCFVNPQENFSFFYFKAGSDGDFSFTVQAADPNEASDIDFNVWGPIEAFEDICDYTANNQPVRSSWTGGALPTGLQAVHPESGITVIDAFDCGSPATPGAGGDRFVSPLAVEEGKYYVVLLDDFGQAIENGGISISFGGTTPGVLVPEEGLPMAGPDTTLCPGQSVTLMASGGAAYFWDDPNNQLSCSNCANPTVTPADDAVYQVQIATTCATVTKTVSVVVYELLLGPDATVCAGASFELNPNPFPDVSYSWTGPSLSCNNCPTPTVSALAPGVYQYYATLTTPFCQLKDTIEVNVLPGAQPQYIIANDMSICKGETVQIGGPAQPGTAYSWTSVPTGLNTVVANPTVTPLTTTKYYLTASNNSCAVPAIDSIIVTVNPIPVVALANDTLVCQGQTVQLANTAVESGVVYSWVPSVGVMATPNVANPVEAPQSTTMFVLTATLDQCTINDTVSVGVIPINIQLNTPDSLRICQGKTITIQADVTPSGTPVAWTPVSQLVIAPDNLSAQATPMETALYTITASVPGCTRVSTVYVAVDSIPAVLDIVPADTMICQGARVLLTSPVYDPAEYQYMQFTWTPILGQLTPDSLFNMVIEPDTTTIYRRLTTNGACSDTAFSVVRVVIPPQMTLIPADTTICPGNAVQLSLTVPMGVEDITWNPTGGLSCTDCNNPIVTPTGSVAYTVSGEFKGCPVNVSTNINVTPPPPLQFPVDVNLCKGESVTLNNAASPGATYTWSSTDPAFTQTSVAQPTIIPLQTATYSVTATNGCTSTGSITINVADASLTASADTAVCRYEPVLLSASGSIPGTYSWSSGQTTQAITVNANETSTYTVTFAYGDGCTQTESVTVAVNGESVELDLPLNPQICPGQSVTLNNASATTGGTYTWTSTPADPTLAANAANPTVAPTVTTTYQIVATLGLCTSTRTVTVNVPSASLNLGPDQSICEDETITLNPNASVGQLAWSTGATSPTIDVAPSGTSTYSVTLTYGNGCTVTDDIVVTVIPSFDLSIVAAPNMGPLGLGETLELSAVVNPTGQYSYVWLENGTTNLGTTSLITTVISTSEDSVRYAVKVTSSSGCVKEAAIGFAIDQPEIVVPNAFTPDGDSKNDGFGYHLVKGGPNSVRLEKMDIYNRWGQKVFTASAGGQQKWDGTVDGKPAPMDTYIYQILVRRADGALMAPLSGEVTLIR